MKVLMITPGWPNKSNPNSSPFIVNQYNSLVRKGIDVDLFNFKSNRNPLNYMIAWVKIRMILRKKSYDLIHAQWGHSALLVLNTSLPLVITFRGMDLEGIVNKYGNYAIYSKLLTRISRFVSNFADEIIVVSQSLGNKLPTKNYTILPSGVDLSLFKPLDKSNSRSALGLPQNKILGDYGTIRSALEISQKRFA